MPDTTRIQSLDGITTLVIRQGFSDPEHVVIKVGTDDGGWSMARLDRSARHKLMSWLLEFEDLPQEPTRYTWYSSFVLQERNGQPVDVLGRFTSSRGEPVPYPVAVRFPDGSVEAATLAEVEGLDMNALMQMEVYNG